MNITAIEISQADVDPSNGPAAHEDLTIREILITMRDFSEHRPGEQCYRWDGDGERWITDADLREFISQWGSEHPTNYKAACGRDWKRDFLTAH